MGGTSPVANPPNLEELLKKWRKSYQEIDQEKK